MPATAKLILIIGERRVIIDREDADILSIVDGIQTIKSHNTFYVQTINKKTHKKTQLHRLIWLKHYSIIDGQIDHINGNGLDNRKKNMRQADHTKNQGNRRKIALSSSKYKGVTKLKNCWQASCSHKYLGVFKIEEDAAKAYDKNAKQVFGEYAYLNFG